MPKERKRSWDGYINEDDLLNEDNDKKVGFYSSYEISRKRTLLKNKDKICFQSEDGDQDIEDMLLLDHDPDDLLNEDLEKDVAADELLLSPHDGQCFLVYFFFAIQQVIF